MKNLNQQQWYLGIAMIAVGVLIAFNLWGLLPIALITGLAIFVYTQQRKEGNTARAVQGGLWLLGMAGIILLSHFIPWAALLMLLAGTSLLLRGNEEKVDAFIQQMFKGLRKRDRSSASQSSATDVPITPNGPNSTPEPPETPGTSSYTDVPNTGPTTRL